MISSQMCTRNFWFRFRFSSVFFRVFFRSWCKFVIKLALCVFPVHCEFGYLDCRYTCIHGTAPSYLAEMCTVVAATTGRHNLRSATHGNLLVPRTRTMTYGLHSFAVCGPCDLPPTLHASPDTLRQF